MIKRLLLIVLCSLLAACGRPPEADILRADVEKNLTATYGDGLFRVGELKRMGTAADHSAPPGETRRIVYYNVELEVLRDVTLGAWDQPGAASLVSLLGAGPRSITGVKTNGNQAGDKIIAHASSIYRERDGRWEMVAPAGFKPPAASTLDAGAPRPVVRELIDTLEQITHSVPYSASGTAQHVVQQELERSLARINGRLSRLQQGYPLAGGPERGEYLAFTQALANLARNKQVRVTPLMTSGSAENIALLRSGDAMIALSQADTARMAYQGLGPFAEQGPFAGLRALGSLYPELVHIVVRDDNALGAVSDLKGKRIALGPEGSAVRLTLESVLAAHGLQAGRDYEVVETPFAAALPLLDAGEIDATAQVIGVPAGPLREALTHAHLKLLPLDASAITKLIAQDPSLMALPIEPNTYPNQLERIPTVGMAALLLTTSDLTADEAAQVVRLVFQGGQDLLGAGSAQGAQVSAANALRGLTVPMHDGAMEALEAMGAHRIAKPK